VNIHQLFSGELGDIVFVLGFVGFFTVPLLTYVALLAIGAMTLPPSAPHGARRRLLGPVLVGYYYWMLGPLFRAVSRTGLRPNQITIASLASALLIGGATLDIVDGQLARTMKMASASGAFLDSTVDRICDGLIFGGCVVYYAGSPMMFVALVVLIMSFTVSYARSRAEALGVSGAEGLMQRADRITILGIALAFSPVVGHHAEGFVAHPFYGVTAGALSLLALLNSITAVTRIVWTMERLKDGSRPALIAGQGPAPHLEVLRRSPTADPRALLNQQAR
jgi:phosphatidylglycerophosphate synthase